MRWWSDISQTGRTRSLLDVMELVKDVGGIVIGMAPSGNTSGEAWQLFFVH